MKRKLRMGMVGGVDLVRLLVTCSSSSATDQWGY